MTCAARDRYMVYRFPFLRKKFFTFLNELYLPLFSNVCMISSFGQASRGLAKLSPCSVDAANVLADPLLPSSDAILNICKLGFELAGVIWGERPCFGVKGLFVFANGLGLNFKVSAAKKNWASFGWRNHTSWLLSSVNSIISSSSVEISWQVKVNCKDRLCERESFSQLWKSRESMFIFMTQSKNENKEEVSQDLIIS